MKKKNKKIKRFQFWSCFGFAALETVCAVRFWAVFRQFSRRLITRKSLSIWSSHRARCAPRVLVPAELLKRSDFFLFIYNLFDTAQIQFNV